MDWRRDLNTLSEIVSDHIKFRRQLLKLAKSDIVKQYRGAALGWMWAVISPAVTIFVFWFAFSIGVRRGHDVDGYPFFLWMISGFIPWFYMKATLTGGAGSIRKYKYLVKRIKFPVDTIPTFVSLSNLIVNLALQIIMIFIFMGFGFMPTKYCLQIPLIIIGMFIFFTAWSLMAGMLSAMSKDFLNLVKSVTQALFWLSGVIYDANRITIPWIRETMLFNPITLVANGYRNAMIYHRWIWEYPGQIRNFVIMTVIMCVLAIWAYKRLKKETPDVI